MIYLPIIGAIALAGGTIFQRYLLNKKGISVKQYSVLEFFALATIMIPLIFFFWKVESAALQTKNIMIFLLVIIASIIANLFTFYSMKWEKINNLEPAKILEPMFVIILALIFGLFIPETYDKNPKIIIPAIISVIALVFLNIERKQIKLNKYFVAAVIGSFFFGLELVISRLILDLYNPITFYFLRCTTIFIFLGLLFHPKIKSINKRNKLYFLLVGAIFVLHRIITYWGYLNLGVIFTTLIMMLGPALIYVFAHIFLKEKYNWKSIISSAIIVGAIIYTIWI